MFECTKTFDIAASHILSLPYESKCNQMHGHNYRISITCQATDEYVANNNGMVVDFSILKEVVHKQLDHRHLNDVIPYHPTAENLARWIWEQLDAKGIKVEKVEVFETDGNRAIFYPENPILDIPLT